jgi:hypothetical protein
MPSGASIAEATFIKQTDASHNVAMIFFNYCLVNVLNVFTQLENIVTHSLPLSNQSIVSRIT